mmetsp:Transcript_22019/g.38663  ORF Transcript_22019/g.38663 Transcript_22019/m.38663 type:complete len:291 (-) Transcript_22019:392-1264(-)
MLANERPLNSKQHVGALGATRRCLHPRKRKVVEVGLQLRHVFPQQTDHLEHLQGRQGHLTEKDVEQASFEFLPVDRAGTINVQDQEQVRKAVHGGSVQNLHWDLTPLVEGLHLFERDRSICVRIKRVEQLHDFRDQLLGFDLFQLVLFLPVLAGVLQSAFDNNSSNQVHYADRHNSDQSQEVESEEVVGFDERYVDGSNGIHCNELSQCYHGHSKRAEIVLHDSLGFGVLILEALVVGNEIHAKYAKNIDYESKQQCRGKHRLERVDKPVDQPPSRLHKFEGAEGAHDTQ